MARPSQTVEEIIRATVERVTSRIVPLIRKALADAAASAAPVSRRPARGRPAARARPRRRPRQEMTRWVADRRARRVPSFVIQMTGGLDTKKKIVAKFGENAAFEVGKPLPAAKPAEAASKAVAQREAAPREVKARPPIVRKAAAK